MRRGPLKTGGLLLYLKNHSRLSPLRNVLSTFWLKSAASLILGLLSFFYLNSYFVFCLYEKVSFAKKTGYIAGFVLAIAAIVATAAASRIWAAAAIIVFELNLLVGAGFTAVTGRPITLTDTQLLYEASPSNVTSFVKVVANLSESAFPLMKVIAAMALLAVLMIWARTFVRCRTNLPLLASVSGIALFYWVVLLVRGETAVVGLPTNVTPALGASFLAADSVMQHIAGKSEPGPVLSTFTADPTVKHIVLIIDESIEAEAFSKALKGTEIDHVRDLGTAYSYANCSATATVMLRRCVSPTNPERDLRQGLSLFELAKSKKFTTVYLDVQGVLTDWAVHDYFDGKEKSFIDEIHRSEEFGQLYDADLNSIEVLARILRQHENTFVIVNKVGVHFPYRRNLPPELAGTSHPYETAVKRSSVGFLTRVVREIPSQTLLFYTSDHGQNFRSKVTHCNLPPEASTSEWMVPLLIVYSDDLRNMVSRIDSRWQDLASHAVLAETLRNLIGYKTPGATSLLNSPTMEETRHRAFYGSSRPLLGRQLSFKVIGTLRKEFVDSN